MAQGKSGYLLHPERFQFSLEPGPQPMFQLFPFLARCLQLDQGLLHLLHLLNIDLLLFELKQRKKMQPKLNNENKRVNFWLCPHCRAEKHQSGRTCPMTAVSGPQAPALVSTLGVSQVFPISAFLLGIFGFFCPQRPHGNDEEN